MLNITIIIFYFKFDEYSKFNFFLTALDYKHSIVINSDIQAEVLYSSH